MLDAHFVRMFFPYLGGETVLTVENPARNERVFLDNTASTQLPLPVLEQVAKTLFTYANIHRGEYDASQISTEEFERAYNIAANLVNAESWREIIFGRNTTEMINLVMRCLECEFRDGDNIVATRLEHNSNYVPWYGLKELLKTAGKGIEVRLVDFDRNTGELDMAQLEKFVDKKTKLVTVTGASNFMGVRPDIKTIGKIAHSSRYSQPSGFSGSYFLVDGAQLVPGTPVDVQDIGCDFLAWSFHKMCLPLGVGGLYAKKDIMSKFSPFLFGGDMVEDVKEGQVKYKELPWIYTAGTPNIIGTIATGHGINFLINLGLGNLFQKDEIYDDEEIEMMGKQMVTHILMNTPRGDFDYQFRVPEELGPQWKTYLARHPATKTLLKNPESRLKAVRKQVMQAMENIQHHERELTQYAMNRLAQIPGVQLYGPRDAKKRTGLIAFTVNGMNSQAVAFELNKQGIEARNGNHCASLAHQHAGVESTVRFSFYVYNTADDAERGVNAVEKISRGAGN